MIVVTGAAGFIGSAMVAKLNELGEDRILLVDELGDAQKWKNLLGKKFIDYLHKDKFLQWIKDDGLGSKVEAIIHMGACSSTTETNVDYLMENNYRYSQTLAEWCFAHQVRFVYASSAATYGDGSLGFSDDDEKMGSLRPMNPYGFSKHVFDLWILKNRRKSSCVGIKFFNVFGPNEFHKGGMASVAYKAYHQIQNTGQMRLFKSYKEGYSDGEQKRDFVYVKDCVDIMMWLLAHPEVNGIYNLGTGQSRSWNDLSRALFAAMKRPSKIEYIEMPEDIRDAYQYFTQADMKKLTSTGCPVHFRTLEAAIEDYVVKYLDTGLYY